MAENQMHGFGHALQHFVCSTHPHSTTQTPVEKLVKKMKGYNPIVLSMAGGRYERGQLSKCGNSELQSSCVAPTPPNPRKTFVICVVVVSPSNRRPPRRLPLPPPPTPCHASQPKCRSFHTQKQKPRHQQDKAQGYPRQHRRRSSCSRRGRGEGQGRIYCWR